QMVSPQEKNGSRPITENTARELERKLGLPDYWMDKEHGQGGAALPATLSETKADVISIPRLDVAAAMGCGLARPGTYVDVIEQITVNRDWLRRNVTPSSPSNLAVITGLGDSMEGTFNDGDLLLVDRGISEVRIDAVYVLALNDELYI